MISITYWPRIGRAGTITLDLADSTRVETTIKQTVVYLPHTEAQQLLDSMWAHGMRPSHIREAQKKGSV